MSILLPARCSDEIPTQKSAPEGYATVNSVMPLYISENGPNAYKIGVGSRFVVICESGVSSTSAQIGDLVSAKLANQIDYAGQVIIPKSAILEGSVSLVDRARHSLRADLPGRHWLNAQGSIGLQFNRLQIGNKSIAVKVIPAPHSAVESVAAVRFPIVTDKQGDITVFYGSKRFTLLSLAIEGGSMAAGPMGLLIGPAASGIVGAASPSYALGHPANEDGTTERGKGFLLGLAKGLPGGGLVTGAIEHGSDLHITVGDKLILELQEDLELVK